MNTDDNFMELLNDEKKEFIDIIPFKIYNIKLVHHHFNSGDLDIGSPIETTLELKSKFNLENQKLEWTKIISHTYYSLIGDYKIYTDFYETAINNDLLIKKLESIDLRHLKNNYFNDINPERFTHWEICYNEYFKISGTYDREIDEIIKLSELLDFKKVIKDECHKIKEKIHKNK